jgi:hypothetical protein
MDYTYFLETQANKNITLDDFSNKNSMNVFYILCYHVNNEAKYPFLQFMLEKIPFCNNFIKEQFTLPFVLFDNHTNLENIVLNIYNPDVNTYRNRVMSLIKKTFSQKYLVYNTFLLRGSLKNH